MNSSTKKTFAVVSTIATLTFASVIIWLGASNAELRSTLTRTIQKLTQTENQLAFALEDKQRLEAQIVDLRDSIEVLHARTEHLEATISNLKGTISDLNVQVQKKEEQVASLSKDIEKLFAGNSANEQKISRLEEERMRLLKEMEDMDRERTRFKQDAEKVKAEQDAARKATAQAMAEADRKEQDLAKIPSIAPAPKVAQDVVPATETTPVKTQVEHELKNRKMERMNNIRTLTEVKFGTITLLKDEDSKPLKQIKKNNWRYTHIEFDLVNASGDLKDEQFLVRIVDARTGQVVPMNESNPGYPQSSTGNDGFRFTYDGSPVKVRYFNNQLKESSDYEVQILYLTGNLVMPLANGKTAIVRGGEVIQK